MHMLTHAYAAQVLMPSNGAVLRKDDAIVDVNEAYLETARRDDVQGMQVLPPHAECCMLPKHNPLEAAMGVQSGHALHGSADLLCTLHALCSARCTSHIAYGTLHMPCLMFYGACWSRSCAQAALASGADLGFADANGCAPRQQPRAACAG